MNRFALHQSFSHLVTQSPRSFLTSGLGDYLAATTEGVASC